MLFWDSKKRSMLLPACLTTLSPFFFLLFFSFFFQEALALLGIRHHFKGVFGAKAMGDACKPEKEAFLGVLKTLRADPAKTGR